MKSFGKLLVAGCAAAAAFTAQAGTDSVNFQVQLTIVDACDIHTTAPTPVDFGSVTRSSAATDRFAVGTLRVDCSFGTPYDIGLSGGANTSGSVLAPVANERRMKHTTNAAAPLVPYDLYRDAAHTSFWGNTIGVSTLSGTGTGAVEATPIYGKLNNVNFPAGVYLDTVTAYITF